MKTNDIMSLFQVTEVELVYRNKQKPEDRRKVTSPSDAYDVLINAWDMNKIELVEQFKVLLLDRSNKCLGISTISSGGVSSCIVDPKIVYATALKARASGLILCHNHPSGNTEPSKADLSLTERLTEGGKLLDIAVLDHLIVTPQHYHSLSSQTTYPAPL